MIVWLASYPKSGNTLVRSILTSLIYSEDGNFNFNLLKKIDQYPQKKHFKGLTDKFNNLLELSKFWTLSQDRLNADKKIKFFNKGKKDQWKNILNNKIRIEIEKKFKNEMSELKYI